MKAKLDAPRARSQKEGLENAVKYVLNDEQMKQLFPGSRRTRRDRLLKEYIIYRVDAMRQEDRRTLRKNQSREIKPSPSGSEYEPSPPPSTQDTDLELQEQSPEVSQVRIVNNQLLHFLTKTCNPPLGHLYEDLKDFGCEMQHLRAMSKWPGSLLSDTLERLRIKVAQSEAEGEGAKNLWSRDGEEANDQRRMQKDGEAVRIAGGESSRAMLMDWEVLRYHIIGLSESP
ncbi:hypothetical protein BDN72DRAFT_848017 [Pluteus cervinus]|uniref:Uncharacterized protein n=1 Tax=Pluteus cervinus TaxID=181527 RepID=A0ACD3ABT5_9AGAR|nr:hypothetical protein BDN72DRAFT_848017 [Pluteus cervinus]